MWFRYWAILTKETSMIAGQKTIQVSNTAVAIPLNGLLQGVTITAGASNAAALTIGNSDVTNVVDGTGNGDILTPGGQKVVPLAGATAVYVNGAAGDFFSYIGA